jgi:hypothetical protein
MSRTHHSNADLYERIQRDDMMQAAVILAAMCTTPPCATLCFRASPGRKERPHHLQQRPHQPGTECGRPWGIWFSRAEFSNHAVPVRRWPTFLALASAGPSARRQLKRCAHRAERTSH